jgi:hypothetical protein
MSRAQRIIAAIVAVITAVLLAESYGAMVTAARAGGRAIPELWPLGTEALALAMEVSVLEAKRLRHRGVLRLSWALLVASLGLSTMLQVAVAPPSLVGYVTAGATPVWLLGSFAVLSLLYHTSAAPQRSSAEPPATSADLQRSGAEVAAGRWSPGADPVPSSAEPQRSGAEVSAAALVPSAGQHRTGAERQPVSADAWSVGAAQVTKRQHAQRVWAELAADAEGEPVTGARLAAAAGLSASYARALAAEFHAHPPTPAQVQANGDRPAQATSDPEAGA